MTGSLLTPRELADQVGVNERTIWRWLADGMPAAIRRGSVVRFDLDEVLAWHRDQQRRSVTTLPTRRRAS